MILFGSLALVFEVETWLTICYFFLPSDLPELLVNWELLLSEDKTPEEPPPASTLFLYLSKPGYPVDYLALFWLVEVLAELPLFYLLPEFWEEVATLDDC